MKLRKVVVDGKTYYEEIIEEKEVVNPEIIEEENNKGYDSKENKNYKESGDDKTPLQKAVDGINTNIKNFGSCIKKEFDSAKIRFDQNKKSRAMTVKLVKILPFMDEEDIHEIVQKIIENDKKFKDVDLVAIMPFVSKEDADTLFLNKLNNDDSISIELVHFVSSECLSKLVDAYIEGKYENLDVDALYPFLDKEDVKKLFYFELNK